MAFHHLQTLTRTDIEAEVSLLVGMSVAEGISLSNHKGFQQLVTTDYVGRFQCSYIIAPPPVHSKVYAWSRNGEPFMGFAGSANYTQNAFGRTQREAMASMDPTEAIQYYNGLLADSIYCTHPDTENLIQVYNETQRFRRRRVVEAEVADRARTGELEDLPYVRLSLLDRNSELPQRSGLNWGQRPELHREPNQAYIRLPASVYKADFFPNIGMHFTVLTDDGKVLICTRAQANGKAIHTPHNNSLIGEYFRNRLGIAFGQLVTTENLVTYGRTHVDFYKIDDETYYMDFSVLNG